MRARNGWLRGEGFSRGRGCSTPRSYTSSKTPKWRPVSVLDEWVAKEARPISLRQLMVFGRSLTESRLISSANYVRTEIPTRLAHRIRDMQQLPYVVVTNPHICEVYDLYYDAFDLFRKVKEINSLEDNDDLCKSIRDMLRAHLTIIPTLSRGILECNGLMDAEELDKFMNTILRARISRRVIAQQHLSLTETFHAPWFLPGDNACADFEFIGEVLTKCVAKDVVERCGQTVRDIAQRAYGPSVSIPAIKIDGHLDATFPFILSHLEYIIGELLRNSVQAVAERYRERQAVLPPIEVTICESNQHVIVRVSDQGGGVPRDVMPHLWSFSKGAASARILANLGRVPKMAATMQEVEAGSHQLDPAEVPDRDGSGIDAASSGNHGSRHAHDASTRESSLASLSSRPPNLRLGMGLPLSRVYAEYWAGSLSLHNLEGYGVDVFLQISKLGNKNEQLTTRASIDAV